jgi:hypothetical protein
MKTRGGDASSWKLYRLREGRRLFNFSLPVLAEYCMSLYTTCIAALRVV